MNNQIHISAQPVRILYTMFRVSNLERSIAFYQNALGMHVLRRETFTEGRFTFVFLGYGDAVSSAAIELTSNWDEGSYDHGSGYGHVALEVANIYETIQRLEALSVKVVRAPGPMKFASDETNEREVIAFIEDPDGYRLELIEAAG